MNSEPVGIREKETYVIIDGLGLELGCAHCYNSARMDNSELVERERDIFDY